LAVTTVPNYFLLFQQADVQALDSLEWSGVESNTAKQGAGMPCVSHDQDDLAGTTLPISSS
jgi:hypothetical protein